LVKTIDKDWDWQERMGNSEIVEDVKRDMFDLITI